MSSPAQLGPTPAQIDLMGHNIDMMIRAGAARRRRRARLGLGIASVAVVASVTAGTIGVIATPAQQSTFADCYTTTDLAEPDRSQVIYDPADVAAPAETRAEVTVESCLAAYGARGVAVPNPTPCILPDLRVGVFPNEYAEESTAFCASLGLSPVRD